MRYLITGRFIDPGPMASPEQVSRTVEHLVIPSLNMLDDWEKQGRILGGGIHVGQRAGSFIMNAASHDEVDKMLLKLPFWGVLEWEVRPLQSFAGRAADEQVSVASLKGYVGVGG